MDVELLDSNETADVTLALSLLSSQVHFLSRFTLDARFVLDPSNQFNISFDIYHNNTMTSTANVIMINWVLYIHIISMLILINIVGNLEIV